MSQFEHARHERRLCPLCIQHRIETFVAPLLLTFGVIENPRRRNRCGSIALIHGHLAGTPGRALRAPEIELAGRIVAGVAGNTLFGKDRLDISGVRNSRTNQRGLAQRCTAHHQRHGAGEEAKKHVPLS